jgi:hypothetical protein
VVNGRCSAGETAGDAEDGAVDGVACWRSVVFVVVGVERREGVVGDSVPLMADVAVAGGDSGEEAEGRGQ